MKSTVAKIFLIFGIFVLVAGGVILYFALQNKGLEVRYKDELINGKSYVFNKLDNMHFSVGGGDDYEIKISPNAEKDFTFNVNGEPVALSVVGELTGHFNVEKVDGGFTMLLPEDITLQGLLEKVYPGAKVELPANVSPAEKYFTLSVSGKSGIESKCTFGINIVWLDAYEVVF